MSTRRMIRRKLLVGWVASAVLLLLVTGLVFAVMLRAAQHGYVRADMAKTFAQVAQRLAERREQVHRATLLLSDRPEVVATIHLVNEYEDPADYQPRVFEPEKRRLATLVFDEARAVGVDALGMFDRHGGTVAVFTTGQASGHVPGAGYSTFLNGERRTLPVNGGEPWPYRIALEAMAPKEAPAAPRDLTLAVNSSLALVSMAPIRHRLGEGQPRSIGTVLAGRVFGPDDIADIVGRSGLKAAFIPEGAVPADPFSGYPLTGAEPALEEVGATVAVRELSGHLVTAARLHLDDGRRAFILLAAEPPRLGAVLSTYGEASALALLPMALLFIPAGALVLRRWVIMPLEALAQAARSVRAGHPEEVRLAERDDEFGSVAVAFNGMIHDLVAREAALRRSIDELSRANAELTQFASVAAHDLREPVRQIVTYTQYLQRDLAPALTADQARSMSYVVDSARRMYDLIGALLDYAASERGSGRRGPVDVDRVLVVVRDLLAMSLQAADARLDVGPMPTVEGDEVQLVQVFQNLIANALKFQPPGRRPEISVRAERVGAQWMFHVRDNGIGFEPDMAERIFEMFERLQPLKGYSGTGIGLPICRKIIEINGGRIWATSTPGQGSTFSFTWGK